MKLKNPRTKILSTAIVLGLALIIIGIWFTFPTTEKTYQHIIPCDSFSFDGSLGVVSGKSYYTGGGPQIYLEPGDIIEASVIHPPADFNGSLSNVYFAVWESTPQTDQVPDQLIPLNTLPANQTAKSNYLFFQLISDEPLKNLAPKSTWTGDFIDHSHGTSTLPQNAGVNVTGIVVSISGIAVVVFASYETTRLFRTGKSPRSRRA